MFRGHVFTWHFMFCQISPKASFSLVSMFFLVPCAFCSWVWQLDFILSFPQISLPGEMPAFVTYNTELLHTSLHLWVSWYKKEGKNFIMLHRKTRHRIEPLTQGDPWKCWESSHTSTVKSKTPFPWYSELEHQKIHISNERQGDSLLQCEKCSSPGTFP